MRRLIWLHTNTWQAPAIGRFQRVAAQGVGRVEAPDRQSSIAARTRSVTSAAVAFQSNGTEISTSGCDVTRTANFRRSGVATIQASAHEATLPDARSSELEPQLNSDHTGRIVAAQADTEQPGRR